MYRPRFLNAYIHVHVLSCIHAYRDRDTKIHRPTHGYPYMHALVFISTGLKSPIETIARLISLE